MSGALVSGFFTWRFTFYFTALIGILWSTLWVFMATSDPKEHKLIGKDELNYIQFELEKLNKGKKMSAKESRKQSAPWIRIVTNPVVLSFMLTKFTVKLSTDAQSMQIPMYLKKVFRVSEKLVSFWKKETKVTISHNILNLLFNSLTLTICYNSIQFNSNRMVFLAQQTLPSKVCSQA